ncbi:MAG TPA: pseudouridine synthase [Mycobacteriales bacterium]|nr:pseudouridine synthase [Mycobacteriales bacterium]
MSPSTDSAADDGGSGVRLQKVLAAAGLGSRRACEALISAGRVQVNGTVARLGSRVDPQRDTVAVDGAHVPTAADAVYLAVNKPRGVLTTMSDERGRPCVGDLLADIATRVHHVGRLDADSEGLLLMTNDGRLGHRLTHPSFGVVKTYLVEVDGVISRAATRALRAGVELEDGLVTIDEVVVVDAAPGRSVLEVSLHEGRNRVVRRVFDAVGFPVTRLVRTTIGPIRLDALKPGRHRHLQPGEVRALYRAVGL